MVFVPRDEGAPYHLAALRPHGNVLEVRVRRREPPRFGERLRECRVDAAFRIDELRKLVDVGRFQFRARPVFENVLHHGMRTHETRERLFVRRVLPARRLLDAVRRKSQLLEEHGRELLGAVGVEARARIRVYGAELFHYLGVEFAPVFLERPDVYLHALALHVDENLDERLLRLGERAPQSLFGDLARERAVEPERDVRVLGGVVENFRGLEGGHRKLLFAALLFADQLLDRDWPVRKILAGERVEIVPGGSVDAVVREHRVFRRRGEPYPVARENRPVELDVVRDERLGWIREKRPEEIDERAVDIPRPPRSDRERKADELAIVRVGRVVAVVRRSGFSVERDGSESGKLLEKRLCAFLGVDKRILVGSVGNGRERRAPGPLLPGGRRGLVDVDAELLRETAHFVFRAERGEFFRVRGPDLQRIPVDFDGDVGSYLREEARHLRVLGPRNDLLAELPLDFGGAGENPVKASVRLEKLDRRLLPHPLHAGDVVRSVAGEGEIIDHARGRRNAPMLAHLRLVVDLRGLSRAARAVEFDAGPHELRRILVGRHHVDVEARLASFRRERAHHVVGLETFFRHDFDSERVRELVRPRYRVGDVLGHLLALRLVLRVRLVPERRPARVHREDEPVGPAVLDDGDDAGGEPDQRGRVYAGRRDSRVPEEGEMPLVQKGHEIHNEEPIHLCGTP